MKQSRRRLWTWTISTVAGLIVLAAVVTGLFRGAVLLLPGYRDDLERKIGEMTSTFKAEPLTRVTNWNQKDTNRSNFLGVEANGLVKMSTKEFAVAFPNSAAGLERGLMTLGHCWVFSRMRSSAKSQLVSCGMDMFSRYIKYLKGPEVWGKATVDEHDKVISTPALTHLHQFLTYNPMRLTVAPCSCDISSLIFMPRRGIKLGLTFKKVC